MVTLSKSIVSKIKDKQGEITEDEVCIKYIYVSLSIKYVVYMIMK